MLKKLLLIGLMCLPGIVKADDLNNDPPPPIMNEMRIYTIRPTPDYVAPKGSKFFTIQETENFVNNGMGLWTDLPNKNKDFILTQLTKYLKNPETENLFTLLNIKSEVVYSHQCPIDMWRTKEHSESLFLIPATFCFGQYQTYSEYKEYMNLYYIYSNKNPSEAKYLQLLYHDTPYLIPTHYDIKDDNHDISFFAILNRLNDKKNFSSINFNTKRYCINEKDFIKNVKFNYPDMIQGGSGDISLNKEKTKVLSISTFNGCISSFHYVSKD